MCKFLKQNKKRDQYWTPTVIQECHMLALTASSLRPPREIQVSSFAAWEGRCCMRLSRCPQVTRPSVSGGERLKPRPRWHPPSHPTDSRGNSCWCHWHLHLQLSALLSRGLSFQIPVEWVLGFFFQRKGQILQTSIWIPPASAWTGRGFVLRGNAGICRERWEERLPDSWTRSWRAQSLPCRVHL